ncbi:MAG TPA: hypothetical protein VMS31_20350, partial [Pyrinomonadaceae bacterium]|nr:hypothetical protein [Pyrinomonadaceae bacterium]
MHKRLFPQRFFPDLRYLGELKWAIKCIVTKNKGKIAPMTCVQSLWKLWIPKGNRLVANACPAKSRIIPNQHRKSKKAKGKRANPKLPGSPLCPDFAFDQSQLPNTKPISFSE